MTCFVILCDLFTVSYICNELLFLLVIHGFQFHHISLSYHGPNVINTNELDH